LVIFLTVAILYIIIRFTPIPPAAQLKRASAAISNAKSVVSDPQNIQLLKQAENKYDSALYLWKQENTRWILSRDFSKTKALANRAEILAQEAKSAGLKDKSNIRLQLSVAIDSIEKSINYYRPLWKMLPVQGPENKRYEKALMLFSEAKLAYKNKDYQTSQQKLINASTTMNAATQTLESTLKNYFLQYAQWQEMVQKTIQASKKDKAILIDKFAAKCHLYKKGKLIKSYNVEFGLNWIGDKRREGDKATPEGYYKITRKKKGSETVYHKALLLNYPNEQDRARFDAEIKSGTLPKSTRIGGLIEIHGGGGRGVHWTDGCIALTDSEIDVIYDFTSINTPITIVGSMVNLNEIKLSLQK
jgi:hypothetical protein